MSVLALTLLTVAGLEEKEGNKEAVEGAKTMIAELGSRVRILEGFHEILSPSQIFKYKGDESDVSKCSINKGVNRLSLGLPFGRHSECLKLARTTSEVSSKLFYKYYDKIKKKKNTKLSNLNADEYADMDTDDEDNISDVENCISNTEMVNSNIPSYCNNNSSRTSRTQLKNAR